MDVEAIPEPPVSAVRVHVAGDHAAFDLKEHLVEWLKQGPWKVVDHGPHVYDALDDYPPFVLRAAEAVASDPDSLGVVLGGSENGEQIAANKVKGVRAALAWSADTAVLARQHNDANVVSIGARQHNFYEATRILKAFLESGSSTDTRHKRRIDMLTQYETGGTMPPLPPEPA